MVNAAYLTCMVGLAVLSCTSTCLAQESALEKLRNESARLRQSAARSEGTFWQNLKGIKDDSATLRGEIVEWVESVLPATRLKDSEIQFLNESLRGTLARSGLTDRGDLQEHWSPGSISGVELTRPKEDPGKLLLITGVTLPCGFENVAYIYDYSTGRRRRTLESISTREHDEIIDEVHFSGRDASGSQLILITRSAVQCGSSWNGLSYDLFRFPATAISVVPVLRGEHSIWFGADKPFQLRLQPNDLLMEIRDRSIDAGVHNRAHVLHYQIIGSSARRVDPVALQPRDFVDEWLTRPWSEMASRSASSSRDKLKAWHDRHGDEFVGGDFLSVAKCTQTGQWQIGLDLSWFKKGEPSNPETDYFLVRQSDTYSFTMLRVSSLPDPDCIQEVPLDATEPTLFP